MVKTHGPIGSLDAAGTLAKTVTCSHWKGRPYMKTRSLPTDARSPVQLASRLMLRWLNLQWAQLSQAQRDTWLPAAAAADVAGYNSFLALNMQRWSMFLPPTKRFPATEENTPPVIASHYPHVTSGVRGFWYHVDYGTLNDGWAYFLFINDTKPFTPSKANLIDVQFVETEDEIEFHVAGIEPGTWYVRGRACTDDGVWGTWRAHKTLTITAE